MAVAQDKAPLTLRATTDDQGGLHLTPLLRRDQFLLGYGTAFLRPSAALLFLIDLTLDGPLLAGRFFGASPEFGEVEIQD